jgi:hypothetical protein
MSNSFLLPTLLLPFAFGPLAFYPSKVIWNNVSYRHSVRCSVLSQGRHLHWTKHGQAPTPRVKLEATTAVSGQALDGVSRVHSRFWRRKNLIWTHFPLQQMTIRKCALSNTTCNWTNSYLSVLFLIWCRRLSFQPHPATYYGIAQSVWRWSARWMTGVRFLAEERYVSSSIPRGHIRTDT